MRSRTIVALAASITILTSGLAAGSWTTAAGSSIRVEGTSTLHAWHAESTSIQGTLEVEQAFFENGSTVPSLRIEIPTRSLLSDKDKMNKLMWEALKADQHPKITWQLTHADSPVATANGYTIRTTGRLTIAGVTRDVTMPVQVTRNGNSLVVTGNLPVVMTEYGMRPPTAMMGTIRTGDRVEVTFRWVTSVR